MIIAPVAGINYLFYASGDMGAGQFSNATRPIKSQLTESYEGKILRFNLEADADAGLLDRWIPADNPYNGGTQSAVWSSGMRNNQGFAYANGKLFGSSHGPFSDDELNILKRPKTTATRLSSGMLQITIIIIQKHQMAAATPYLLL
jgi:glucose/arabinose dehydrogenase